MNASTIILPVLLAALSACAPQTPIPNPLWPAQLSANALVMLENACEDPVDDAQTLTPLEATADMFMLPVTMVIGTVRLATYVTVGLGMVLAGKDPHATVDQINYVLSYPTAGPNPDRVRYHPGMVKDGGGCG